MKTKQIGTWLPVFSGFYNTIWESDNEQDQEIEHLNEERAKKGLPPAEWDDFVFDYDDYNMQVIKGIAKCLERDELKEFVTAIVIERLNSPKEYNFRNDSADVTVTLTAENEERIMKYLQDNRNEFEKYLLRYKSRSGFISSYPHEVDDWMDGDVLGHAHKLGAVLDFIANNEYSGGDSLELSIYYNVEKYLSVTNYTEIVEGKLDSDLNKD